MTVHCMPLRPLGVTQRDLVPASRDISVQTAEAAQNVRLGGGAQAVLLTTSVREIRALLLEPTHSPTALAQMASKRHLVEPATPVYETGGVQLV